MENQLVHQSTRRLLSVLPESQGYLAPGGHHGWVGENPELFARMAQAWFDQTSLPPELIPVRPPSA